MPPSRKGRKAPPRSKLAGKVHAETGPHASPSDSAAASSGGVGPGAVAAAEKDEKRKGKGK
jgi:hypothetical protein